MIAYIESPLQLICAIEFNEKYKKIKNFYIRKSTKQTDEQILYIINKYSSLNFNYSFLPKLEIVNIFHWIYFIVSNFHKKILVGNNDGIISSLFLNKILGDDGTKTISIIARNKKYRHWTFFDLHNYKNHSFEFFKFNFKTKNISTNKSVYFIGQKHIEEKLVKKDSYLSLLKKIKDKYKNYTLYYFKHRGENEENLKEIKRMGFKIKNINYPIEFHPIEENVKPDHVIGFCSSALITLNEIYNLNFSFYVNDQLLNKSNYENNYKEIYRYLNKQGNQILL